MMSDRQQLIELVQESIRQVRAAMDEVPLPHRTLNPCTVDRKALAGLRLVVQAHNTYTEELLSALEAADARTPVPPELFEQAQRFAMNDESLRGLMPWENMAMEGGDVIRALLPHLRPEAGERLTREECWQELREAIEAAEDTIVDSGGVYITSGSPAEWWACEDEGDRFIGPDPIAALRAIAEAAKPQPDFAGMTHEERKAWLRERGRLAVLDEIDGSTTARLRWRNGWSSLIAQANTADEPDALLALCEAVAAKERGEDE